MKSVISAGLLKLEYSFGFRPDGGLNEKTEKNSEYNSQKASGQELKRILNQMMLYASLYQNRLQCTGDLEVYLKLQAKSTPYNS